MRTPTFLPPFDYELSTFFGGWPDHPAGRAAIAILTRADNVDRSIAASDAGRPALDPIQEELVATLRAEHLGDEGFKRFLGNFQRRLMERVGYELVAAAVPLPNDRRILLRSAATYRRARKARKAA